ncbi:MAG TPA: LacI family DNA-binding transcriptional regulator [Gaiellaceae bacterium]|nr:LacI family DNA-binding transcriptional regulator [Gaiellaceae bacterium]
MTTARAQTIADIARLAGVSKSTVSRALNDSPLIGAETKDRIRAIAAEHHFAMNEPARRLSRRQTNVVGLVMFDWGMAKRQDLFMLEVMGGVSTGLHQDGYELLIVQPRPDDQGWARRYVETGQAGGFVFHHAQCSPPQIQQLVDDRIPFVVWGAPSERKEYSSVGGDSVNGGRLATEHLLARGCRRIGMIGGPSGSPEIDERRAGYEAALTAAGVEVDPSLVVHLPWSAPDENAAEAVGRLLERAPDLDGIFAHSDRWALGALAELHSRAVDVPGEVAVVGYDDIAIAAHSHPPLTTIRQQGDLVGRLLARTLVQQLQTGAITNVSIPAELVVRESA